ncbi:MAG: hypothetical protein M1281_00795 [Chloroflexi bacterium]|nr:hypothetical protein [Chloroflexota bacterium]
MSTTQVRVFSAGVFFLIIFLSGFWLRNSGRPVNGILLTVHKFISLGAIAYLAVTVSQVNQVMKLSTLELTACMVTGLFFLGTIITGGLSSIDKVMPGVVYRLHQIAPYLTALSTAATLYLLLVVRSLSPTT